jgi:hypothetical protein
VDLRRWAVQTRSSRLAAEAAELGEARSVVGKVIIFAALAAGTSLSADFGTRYPEWAAIADRLNGQRTASQDFSNDGGVTPSIVTQCDNGTNVGCGYAPMYTSQLAKQTQPYNCGAASMQGIAWNNPTGAVYKSQATWESILGTTPSNGTSIYNIKNAINSYTDWDSPAYAGTYVVVSISSWAVSNYRTMFAHHLRDLSAPVQLHPVLNSSTSTYYPGSTSGHFNVLMGYDYSVGDWNHLYEPAGGPPQGNIYPSLTAWEDTVHIRLAQLANSNQNISY